MQDGFRLNQSGFQIVCIETRHAQRFLSSRPNKTDHSDSRSIASASESRLYRRGVTIRFAEDAGRISPFRSLCGAQARAGVPTEGLAPRQVRRSSLEHDPEKWKPVFRKDHAQTKG
jgi:hypothetical protein